VNSVLYVSTSLRRTNLEDPNLSEHIAGTGADVSRDGLFRVTLNGDSQPKIEHIGLSGQGGMRAAAITDNETPSTLYASTFRGGVFRSKDAGDSWHEINSGIAFKEVWSLVQHPMTGELYAGTGPGSIFKSVDRGDSWQECEGLNALKTRKNWSFPGPPFTAHVKGLGLNPTDPNHVWGAVEVGWIVRSLDGGNTWENLRNGESHDSHYVTVMPDNPDVVVSSSGEGVFRSEDGGENFVEANDGVSHRYMTNLVVHPDKPDVLFTAGANGSPRGWDTPPIGADTYVYRSEDQGQSWVRLTAGLPETIMAGPRAMCGDPADPQVAMVGLVDGSVWGTRDGGNSFECLVEGLPPVNGLSVVHV
jgi:photosystem II stability/assembly factor-like uncharacterized protein